MNSREITSAFRREFHAQPTIFSAPGRVNLIGEHTDYNQGFVLPSAIGFYVHVAISQRQDRKLVMRSAEFPQNFDYDLGNLPQRKLGSWCDYVLGVALMLERTGHALKGANLLIHGEVPTGAGLSSSAAVEVASALALLSLGSKQWPFDEVARLCQRAENEFVGARVGIMDQFISCFGRESHAVLLDCRSLAFQLVPIPEKVRFVISNTKVKHQHSGGEYNRRREECDTAAKILAKTYPDVQSLRDVSRQQLTAVADRMPTLLYKRALHVITENDRVLQTAAGFRARDLQQVGQLMRDSHRSLRDDYEVSCRELDLMVEAAEGLAGYYGGRMTGGGFGGCTVSLVDHSKVHEFAEKVAEGYQRATGVSPDVFICSPANGAALKSSRLAGKR